ncbi:MAG: hypothetical protein IPP82_15295 [Xanthomonadales bacterium]|nr:hypothetical protein [Xanthomonadales bacterium]
MRIHVVGFFDPNEVFATLVHRSVQDDDNVIGIRVCGPGDDFLQRAGCATLFNHLTLRQGTSINVVAWHAPRMTVAATAPSVS